jgi:hypothetical protein
MDPDLFQEHAQFLILPEMVQGQGGIAEVQVGEF